MISQFGSILDANLIMLIRTLLQNNKIVAINDFSKTAAGLKEYINSRNASYDVAIGTQSSWLEASLEDYQAFRNVLDSIDALLIHSIGNEKFLIDLDSSKISIKIAGLNAKVRDFTDKEIEQEFRAENGIYKVNVTNDIWLPYSHDDALDYIRKSKKAVEITGRIIIRTFDDPGRIVILG